MQHVYRNQYANTVRAYQETMQNNTPQDIRNLVESSTSPEHRALTLCMLTACGERDQGHTAQLVLLAVLLKEVAGPDKTVAAVAEALFTGMPRRVCGSALL